MDIPLKKQELETSLTEKKQRLKMNVIELIIGLILLVFAFNYLKSHPAEKTSMIAGVDVLLQKAEVIVNKVMGGDGKYVEAQQQLERWYKEIISTMEKGACADEITIQAAKSKYSSLKSLTTAEFKENFQAYEGFAKSYATTIQKNCN